MGDTASNYDFTHQLHNRTPLVLGIVALLAFVLLLLAFRSLAIPLVSIVLNLLSVGAAYGLVTLIFQDGHLQGPLGFTSFGGIISWVPLFMFVFLFGISMDYHVFILSRIRELRAHGATTRDAITRGIASSAGVVTSAALIMVAVFSIFATLPLIDLKILGVGTAVRRPDRRDDRPRHPGPGRTRPAGRAHLVLASLAEPPPAISRPQPAPGRPPVPVRRPAHAYLGLTLLSAALPGPADPRA